MKKDSEQEANEDNEDPEVTKNDGDEVEDVTQNKGDVSDAESIYSKISKAMSKGGGDDDDGDESGEESQDDKPSLQVRGIAKYRQRREVTLAQRQANIAREQANEQQ